MIPPQITGGPPAAACTDLPTAPNSSPWPRIPASVRHGRRSRVHQLTPAAPAGPRHQERRPGWRLLTFAVTPHPPHCGDVVRVHIGEAAGLDGRRTARGRRGGGGFGPHHRGVLPGVGSV